MTFEEKLKYYGLREGDILSVPVSWAAQVKSPIPFLDAVRVRADALGLKGPKRIARVTDIERMADDRGTFVTVMGVLRKPNNLAWEKRKVGIAIFYEEN